MIRFYLRTERCLLYSFRHMWMLNIGIGAQFSHGIQLSKVIIQCSAFYDTLLDSLVINKNIFIAPDSLMVESLLELLDEESLCKDTCIPSPEWSSDHIALLAEFQCRPRGQCQHNNYSNDGPFPSIRRTNEFILSVSRI